MAILNFEKWGDFQMSSRGQARKIENFLKN